MYCSILITVSQEEDCNLHMQWCQVCTVSLNSTYLTPLHMQDGILFLRYCDQNGTVHIWHSCICKLESSSCDTVIRMEQNIPDSPEYHKKRIITCICRGVRYVLFHSDHSIRRRGFQLTYAGVSGMYWNSTYLTPLHMQVGILFL
jgi:hypothetical protein